MTEKIEYFIKNQEELRIFEQMQHLPVANRIEHFDFTTIGLRTETPIYGIKGIKKKSEYTLGGIVAVRKLFNYTNLGLWITFEWLKHSGAVGVRKVIFKPLNAIEISKLNKSNRDRSINYLQASAVGTPIEAHVNELLKHYKNDVELFIQNGTDDFELHVKNETVEPFLSYLQIVTKPPTDQFPAGKKVIDSILEQIA